VCISICYVSSFHSFFIPRHVSASL
jgi:hypothetical protein